jgi:hypothetical protein
VEVARPSVIRPLFRGRYPGMTQPNSRRALALALFCSVAFTGCGDSSEEAAPGSTPTTLSAEEYVQRADAICQRVANDVIELKAQDRLQSILGNAALADEDKMEKAADVLEEQLDLVGELRRDIQALGVPATNGDDVEGFLSKSQQAEAELEDAINSLRAGDQTAATEALQSYAALSQESAELVQQSQLDFQVCGSGV